MIYELLAIALGVWNITLQLRLNTKRRQAQRLMYSLDMIAHKKWKIITTEVGVDIVDHEGDKAMTIATNRSKHG